MKTREAVPVLATAAMLFAAPALQAQEAQQAREDHVVDRAELETATEGSAETETARREAIRSLLQRPEVRTTAERYGIDLTRVEDAAATLEGEELDRVYRQSVDVREALAGGDSTIVISATTLIFALLVLIIILVS